MKCPNCGAEIGSATRCEYCGSALSADRQKEIERLNKARCPGCASTNVSFSREKKGERRGKRGTSIVYQTVAVCGDCGETWYPAGIESPRKSWLWVLGWIFIFPLPLTLILIKKEMKPVLKYGLIAAAWIVWILLVAAANMN